MINSSLFQSGGNCNRTNHQKSGKVKITRFGYLDHCPARVSKYNAHPSGLSD